LVTVYFGNHSRVKVKALLVKVNWLLGSTFFRNGVDADSGNTGILQCFVFILSWGASDGIFICRNA
jgi:hypothetical protein